MKVMLLAAGFGQRMGALTRDLPKPLLKVANYSLIEHLLLALVKAGFEDFTINLHYQARKILELISDGRAYGVRSLVYSQEKNILGTGGGPKALLSALSDPFLLVSADIYTDFPFASLHAYANMSDLAHLVLHHNPEHKGDFYFANKRVLATGQTKLSYASIGIFKPELFDSLPTNASLALALEQALRAERLGAEVYQGLLENVGTPEILARLNSH